MEDVAEIQLHLAACSNNYAAVAHLLIQGCDPNAVLKKHLYPENIIQKFKVDLWTPLHCAVDVQSEKIVQLLINHQANVNVEDEYGRTPLNLAASRGNFPIAKLLLDSGAHVDSYKAYNNELTENLQWRIREPLHAAVEANNYPISKMLLENEANVDSADRWNRTPLCLSIFEGNFYIVQLLLDFGADIEKSVDMMDKKAKKTVLHFIAEKLQVKIMKLLSTKFDLKFNETHKILNLCFYRNFNDVTYSNTDKFINVIEVIKEYDKILKILLEYNVDVNVTDIDGFSPLHLASKEGNWRIVKTLLENGAEVDLQENSGKTSLHLALMNKRRAVVDTLLDYEANFLISDNEGLTPLNYQCRFCSDFDLESHVVRIEILKITEKEYLTQDVLSHYERQCFDEIFHLKADCFGSGKFSSSLYTIFIDEFNSKLIRLSKNHSFYSEVFSDRFCRRYPIYGDILRSRLEKAKWRSDLIDKGLEPLSYVLNVELPQLVLEEILSYLSNSDIFSLVRLCE